MKYLIKISIVGVFSSMLLFASCKEDTEDLSFNVDTSQIGESIGPDGGECIVKITASGKWSASTDAKWFKLSPVNGQGPTECKLIVDSTNLAGVSRTEIMQILAEDQSRPIEIQVVQKGYDKFIAVKDSVVDLPSYGDFGKRTFQVQVTTNVPFNISIPGDKPWVLSKPINFEAVLNRGGRPRTITLDFTWENNTRPAERNIDVDFIPKSTVELSKHDKLVVLQEGALPIEYGIKGDSLSILACQRSFASRIYDTGERMRNWPGIIVWERTDKEVSKNPALLGRVRSVKFSNCFTFEDIPYEIQFLNALEELLIYSNGNKFLRRLSTGEYLSELTQLKRLQIFAYGLDRIDPSFKKLVNLEALDLSSNNFDDIPDILTPENFPKLTYLDLGANVAWTIMNLDTPSRPKADWAGLYKTSETNTTASTSTKLSKMFKWKKLKFLAFSYNYMQGELPNMLTEGMPTYTAADKYWYVDYKVSATDTIWKSVPPILIGTPKVLPMVERLYLNLNFFTGKIPDWILYHPYLLRWDPYSMLFTQRDYNNEKSQMPGFNNVPETPNYYYKHYPEQEVE